MKKRVFSVILAILLLGGCNQTGKDQTLTIYDIAYDVSKKSGYTVYISEDGKYTPYLVLTKDYGGNVLLLRKFVFDEGIIYNYYSSYFNGSYIDNYLNETFLSAIDAELRKNIVDTEITITAESSVIYGGEEVEEINRKVFLLSFTEVGLKDAISTCVEGKSLKYFKDDHRRVVAYNSFGASQWTLRTAYTLQSDTVWGISPSGTVGSGATYYEKGIRPAFCLLRDVPIYKDTLDGEAVYIIPKSATQESL